jgi:hypothetical protein
MKPTSIDLDLDLDLDLDGNITSTTRIEDI